MLFKIFIAVSFPSGFWAASILGTAANSVADFSLAALYLF